MCSPKKNWQIGHRPQRPPWLKKKSPGLVRRGGKRGGREEPSGRHSHISTTPKKHKTGLLALDEPAHPKPEVEGTWMPSAKCACFLLAPWGPCSCSQLPSSCWECAFRFFKSAERPKHQSSFNQPHPRRFCFD